MFRKLLLGAAGVMLALVGLAGLVLPVIPGLVLLVAAAGCFSLVSRRFQAGLHQRLRRYPRYRRALRRWRASSGRSGWQRAQLAFWLTLGSLVPSRR